MRRLIGEKIGEVVKVDIEENELAWGEFMHVRVNIDVSRPLLQGKKINIGTCQPCWIHFSYELLPNLCYQCGRLVHGYRDCMLETRMTKPPTGDKTKCFPYGQWPRESSGNERDWWKDQHHS